MCSSFPTLWPLILKYPQGRQLALPNMSSRTSGAIGVLIYNILFCCSCYQFRLLDSPYPEYRLAVACASCFYIGPINKINCWVFACLIGLFSMELWGCVTAWYGHYMGPTGPTSRFLICFSLGVAFSTMIWITGLDYGRDYGIPL